MNNEISSKSLSLSSVDATLAAIIPDTPIVSIAGSTLSEITTTTTSTTTTPTPTPTSYETNKADISSSSSVAGPSIPSSMSGVFPKIVGAATNRATASSTLTSNSKDDSTKIPANIVESTTATSISVINSYTSENIDASNSNHANTTEPPITTNITAGTASTGATTKSPPIAVPSSACNAKPEANTTDKKSKDPELWEEEKFTNLDDQNLKLLLEEAYSYRSPTDKENKSELFLSLLEKAENEKEDITLCRMPTSSRLKRNQHQQHHHHRHKHGGSLQDLDEAVRNESILDPDYFFGSSCGQRNRRINHNSRQKKFSSSVSSRQREGGSLPNNVNFTNCARLFGVGGNGSSSAGGTIAGEVAGIAPNDQQFPFMHELDSVTTGSGGGATVVVAASAGSNNNNGNNNNNSNNNSSCGSASVNSNNSKQQRRNTTRTNVMSSTSLSTTPSATSATKIEAEELVGQPIGVLIGGQVITQKSTASIANNGNNGNETANGSIISTGCRALKDAICSVNVSDCVIEMGETIIDVQQQQQILQSKSQEAVSQGRVYYDRLKNVELMPRNNMMSAVPSRTCFGPTTANAYVDEKVHFTALRSYNPSAAAASGGSKPNQVGGVDTKYLPLGDDYKAYKSVLAIADKEETREVDENGNAVTDTFSMNTTTHATAATVYNPINVTSAPVIASASTNAGSSTQTTKSKSKKQPKQERNVTTVNVQAVAGYRGTDPVEKLVEYIESTTGDDNKNKQKKERKKQEKQDKHNKIKKSNSLEELRSCSKMEVDELKRTAATTESNVMMRNKGKGGKNNSSSAADINKNFDSTSSTSGTTASMKEKSTNVGGTAVGATNRKGERRSWGTEELQYLGDANGNGIKSGNGSSGGTSTAGSVTCQSTVDEKAKEKERKNKNRDSQKDRLEDRDKNRPEKVEKINAEVTNTVITTQNINTVAAGNAKPIGEKIEKQQQQQHNQQIEKSEKAEKRKKSELQQATNQTQTKSNSAEPTALVDVLAMESLLPETAEFHVVTKKKKTKKQRTSLEESNGMGNNNNNSKTHNFIATTMNLKAAANQQQQPTRFNAKFNSNEHSNHNNNNGNNNSNHYQQHHNSNHYHNQTQQHQNQHQHQQNSDKSRRKSTSSVPPSEKSDSSDLDSVHSLPIERASKSASGASSNANSSKSSNKQTRQSKNTAGSVATMSLPQKPQQVQQMPTPFSYAEIAKEAKSLTATITTSAIANNANNSNNNTSADQAAQTHNAVADNNNPTSQPHPPIMTTDEVRNTPLRGQQPQQQTVTGTSNNTSAATSSMTSSTTTAPTATTTVTNTHSTNQNSNPNANKANKTKKSTPKADFPALGSASEVAVAASAARADIFAKAVLNSSQHMTAIQYQQQHNPNTRDSGDNTITTSTVATSKSTVVSHIDMPKDAIHQQTLQSQTQQNQTHLQQQHQQQQHHQQQQQHQQHHQQPLQKSKSVEHETSSGNSSSSNVSYNNTMDHQQYPALKTVKRHSASNFTTLPPTGTTSVVTLAAGVTTQQHNANNPATTQFNFAAAARQVATVVATSGPPAIAYNNEISTAAAVSETTTSNITTGTTTTTAVSKKNPGATKEKTISVTSITNVTPTASNEQNPKKNKKEKQHQPIGDSTSKTLSTTTASLSRKSSAATQTSAAHHGHNESNGKQNINAKSSRSMSTINTATPSSTVATGGTALPQSVASPTVPFINRPAVIILNDDTAGISTDFTFGDFNEDELHFFDDEPEEYSSTGATSSTLSTVRSEDLIEDRSMAKLTSSSPRSGSISTASLQQLNDSGTSSDLCMANTNTSSTQQAVSPQAEDVIVTSSDVTLSPNNSTLTATDNQHNSGIGVSSATRNSSRSNASGSGQSNHSGDSGIYTSTSKMQEIAAVDSSNVNTFVQQHVTIAKNNSTTNEPESTNTETTECSVGSLEQPRHQQLETCNEIESVIIAAARRAANQQQQQHPQQKPVFNQTSTTTAHYQHSNSNSSSFSSSSSVDGGVNRYYASAQSPPPPLHSQPQQQQQQPHYYNNNRQAYAPYAVHHPQQQHMQQLYHQNYNMLPTSQPQPMMVNTNTTPANVYSRSNSDCDEDFVSPPPGAFVVKVQNKEYDLHYLPPNISTNGGSQNEFIVEYVSSVWDEVINSKYTRIYDGQ